MDNLMDTGTDEPEHEDYGPDGCAQMNGALAGVRVLYENHEHKIAVRTIIPNRMWYGTSKWHGPKPQWLVRAWDEDKTTWRDFALKDILTWNVDLPTTRDGRLGRFIPLRDGRLFWPADLQPETIRIEDIAHALALENRYNGHTIHPYSVAQHSLLVVEILRVWGRSPWIQLQGLLHDAAEAYVKDMPSPLKMVLADYKVFEHRAEAAVAQALDVPVGAMCDDVKAADIMALAIERKVLFQDGFGVTWADCEGIEPMDLAITEQPWRTVREAFMLQYYALRAQIERLNEPV